MRFLTLTAPWSILVACGAKRMETRSWMCHYRGPLAIHSAKGWTAEDRALCMEEPFRSALLAAGYPTVGEIPRACIVALCDIVDCRPTGSPAPAKYPPAEHERAFGNYEPGRFFFVLANVRRLAPPLPFKGALGLPWVPPEVQAEIRARAQEGVPA